MDGDIIGAYHLFVRTSSISLVKKKNFNQLMKLCKNPIAQRTSLLLFYSAGQGVDGRGASSPTSMLESAL